MLQHNGLANLGNASHRHLPYRVRWQHLHLRSERPETSKVNAEKYDLEKFDLEKPDLETAFAAGAPSGGHPETRPRLLNRSAGSWFQPLQRWARRRAESAEHR
jgi:hypothetical protein